MVLEIGVLGCSNIVKNNNICLQYFIFYLKYQVTYVTDATLRRPVKNDNLNDNDFQVFQVHFIL